MDDFSEVVDFSDFDDFFSGCPSFFIPSRIAWSDFCDCIDDYTKGDLNES